ncbi:hypothetical protein [Alteromonas sp. BMJM2]|uniref:hypothetical protein n=1 Tax=Alteromonas sp. BMJM2 TaxID=2954241 RepID=UPI0022B42D99|nr:hypothetical protein [Alteromonas sp. BMJM2]
MDHPNYAEYSLYELNDALSNIDKDAHPERVKQILKEIASRHDSSGVQQNNAGQLSQSTNHFTPLVETLHPNWFIRYWRGQVSLPISYWVVGIATSLLIYAFNALIAVAMEQTTAKWQFGGLSLLLYTFIITVVTWQSAGLLRTALKHPLRTGRSGWANVAIIMLGISLLTFSIAMYNTGVPLIKASIQMLVGNGPYQKTEFRVLNDGYDLELMGHIEIGSNELLQEQLSLYPNINRIHLHSQGGRILAAIRMMDTIKRSGAETYVKTECASACTLLFVAGAKRTLGENGKLKFHAPGVGTASAHDYTELGADMKKAYEGENLPAWFITKIMRTPNDTFWVPTSQELLKANIVNDIVDSRLYPISGLGLESSITPAEIESGLLTLDFMVAMKQHDPNAYQRAIDINLDGMLTGKSQNHISNEFRTLLYDELLPIYLSSASDKAVIDFWQSQIAQMRELRKDFPLACASFTYPEEVPEENRYGNEGTVSPELRAQEQDAIAGLIRTHREAHLVMDEETQQEYIQKVLSVMREQNDSYINVVSSPASYVAEPELLCEVSIALNKAFISFGTATSGSLLRSF